ncbi:GUN4 domain-containing protein [Nostoc sp. CCY 9925]|uniref:GUN4 domain-containing protein n=1 Tax=Nostoc sp. CCY 9925 TaxID=3103865 RepID=UPI0039C6DC54
MLELYQQVRLAEEQSQVIADETLEQSELQLSGLVVRQQGHLRIYNKIYREIFNLNWIEIQLNNLRPYSENFRFWVASGETDESRLLRGQALQEAEEWAKDKNLSYQDKQFLAASKEKEIEQEIAVKQQEAALERERQDKEALEARNQLLSEANKKAQRRISIGIFVLVVAVLGAAILGGLAKQKIDNANEQVKAANSQIDAANERVKTANSQVDAANEQVKAANSQVDNANKSLKQAQIKIREAQTKEQEANKNTVRAIKQEQQAKKEVEDAKKNVKEAESREKEILAKLTFKENELQKTSTKNEEAKAEIENVRELVKIAGQLRNQSSSDSDEALKLAAVSFNIDNHELKQSLLLTAKSQVYQQLKDWNNSNKEIKESQSNLSQVDKKVLNSRQGLQVQVLVQKILGDLLAQDKQTQKAIEYYSKAFNILKNHPNETDFTKDNQLLTDENIESVYRSLRKLNPQDKDVETQLTKHLYAQLEYYLSPQIKNWEAADKKTYQLMLNLAKREKVGYLDYEQINSFSCLDLQNIDKLWINADKRFGFSVQKEIWIKTGNRLGIKYEDWTNKDRENYLPFARAVGWYDNELEDTTSLSSGGFLVSSVVSAVTYDKSSGGFVSYDLLYKRIKEDAYNEEGGLPYIAVGVGVVDLGGSLFSRVATCKL